MDLRRNLGTTVRQRRVELGLSQVQLADRVGGETQQSDISRIERGRLPWPRPQLLQSLAAALDLTVLELITMSGWMTQEEFERYRSAPVARPVRPLVVIGQRDLGDEGPLREVFSLDRFRVMTTLDGITLLETIRSTAPAIVVAQQDLPDLDLDQLADAMRGQGLDTGVIVVGQRDAVPAAFHVVEAPPTRAAIQAVLIVLGYD